MDSSPIDNVSGSQIVPALSHRMSCQQSDHNIPFFSFIPARTSLQNLSVEGATDLIALKMSSDDFTPASKSTTTSEATSDIRWSFANNSKQQGSAESCNVSAHHRIDTSISLVSSVHSSSTVADRKRSSTHLTVNTFSSISNSGNIMDTEASRPVERVTLHSSMEDRESGLQNSEH
jgi:hypothetical protein